MALGTDVNELNEAPGTGVLAGNIRVPVKLPGSPRGVLHNAPLDRLPGGLPAGTTYRDPLAIGDNLAVTAAVLDAGNTWSNGDLVAYASQSQQNAGAPPFVGGQHSSILVGMADVQNGDQFDGVWPVDGNVYLFIYARRTDGTSGWTMYYKGRANVLTAPNGTYFALSVNNSGNLVTTQL